jgi:hypothetical protein
VSFGACLCWLPIWLPDLGPYLLVT